MLQDRYYAMSLNAPTKPPPEADLTMQANGEQGTSSKKVHYVHLTLNH